MTVGELLHGAAQRLDESGSETPRLDAEVLLGHVLSVDRATLLGALEAVVGDGAAQTFNTLVERRATGEPVAYIRGLKEFYGLAFSVDSRALIPRPETELLVDLALARIASALTATPRPPLTPPLEILDVGTGSGAIAVSLAVEARRHSWLSELHFAATDVSADALALAVENAVAHGVADAIDFTQADLADGAKSADLIAANLPYIRSDDVPTLPIAASFEPTVALDGGPDGLDFIGRLIDRLPHLLGSGGVALLEIGAHHDGPLRALVADRLPGWEVAIHDDLAGRPRAAEIKGSAS